MGGRRRRKRRRRRRRGGEEVEQKKEELSLGVPKPPFSHQPVSDVLNKFAR
jgi:hypothetical protein